MSTETAATAAPVEKKEKKHRGKRWYQFSNKTKRYVKASGYGLISGCTYGSAMAYATKATKSKSPVEVGVYSGLFVVGIIGSAVLAGVSVLKFLKPSIEKFEVESLTRRTEAVVDALASKAQAEPANAEDINMEPPKEGEESEGEGKDFV